MTSPARFAAVLAVLAILVAGCGGSSSDDKPTDKSTSSSATPADGKTISGTGYSFAVPDGWDTPPSAATSGFDFDSLAADLGDKDGFADNVNVIQQDPSPVKEITDEADQQLADVLKNSNAKGVKVQERTKIDGAEAIHISSQQTLNGKKNLTEQYYVIHAGALNVVTFSYSPDVSQGDRDDLAASVLTTWKWTS